MYKLKKIGKVFTSKYVGTGPSSYEKRIYHAAFFQKLRNTGLDHRHPHHPLDYLPLFLYSLKETVKCKFLATKTCRHKGAIET